MDAYVSAVRKQGLGTRYRIACPEGGRAAVVSYDICAGVRLLALDFRTPQVSAVEGLEWAKGDVHVLHCRRGSLQDVEHEAQSLTAGHVGLARFGLGERGTLFPKGEFSGLSLLIRRSQVEQDVANAAGLVGMDLAHVAGQLEAHGGLAPVTPSAHLAHVIAEIYDLMPPADLGILRVKVFEMLLALQRTVGAQEVGEPGGASPQAVLGKRALIAYRVQELLLSDLGRSATIPQLADELGVSSTVLKESFREVFGVPVHTWLVEQRMRRACEIMEEDPGISIARVAAEVGYSSPNKFSSAFAGVMGATPRRWRTGQPRSGA